jgi:putative hemolysin
MECRLLVEIAVVIALTVINGLLAMSELAVVSARPARLRVMEQEGRRGAAAALTLGADPGRFLSTVQIGITLVGVLSGAVSGATLGLRLSRWLETQGMPTDAAEAMGVGLVVVAITYLSLIIGELVPKQVALRDAEGVAARVAPSMLVLSRVAMPLVWLLDASGRLVLTMLGQRGDAGERMTDEEVRTVIAEAETAGVIESEERAMIAGVMRLADRSAKGLMTPRGEVEVLDLADAPGDIRAQLRATRRSRLPVRDGGPDEIVGVVAVKDVIEPTAGPFAPADLRAYLQKAPVVIDNAPALDVVETLRTSTVHVALVFDEYGNFEGLITSADLLEAIAGVFREDDGNHEPACVRREDGSWLVAGWVPVDELADRLGLRIPRDGDYETVAGFVLDRLARIPDPGEAFEWGGWRIEVVDLDGRRIDKLILSRLG